MDLLNTDETSGAAILDVGAGECCLAEALALSCGASVVWATDAVPKQIWAAAERYHDTEALRFVIADAQDLPFESESFDLVVANLLLHHIEPLEPLLRELFRVLRAGGSFRALEPAPLLGTLVHSATSENEAPVWPARVTAAMRAAGFERTVSRYYWSRLETSVLGPLSPGYRVFGSKPGDGPPAQPRLARELKPMTLAGLQLDAQSAVAPFALRQEQRMLGLLEGGVHVVD